MNQFELPNHIERLRQTVVDHQLRSDERIVGARARPAESSELHFYLTEFRDIGIRRL